MKAGNRAAGDGDEAKGKDLAGEDRPRAVGEARERRQEHRRARGQDSERQGQNRAEFDEGAQVIARRKQQPHRQHRSGEAVSDNHPRQGHGAVGEIRGEDRRHRHPAPRNHRRHYQEESEERCLEDPARAPVAKIKPDHDRDRDGRRDGEESPGARLQRVHHHQRHDRDEDDHDQQHAYQRRPAAELADFVFRHLAERFPVAPYRAEERDEVLHRAAEHPSDDNPDRAGQISELRGEDRADQRPGAGYRGEVVAEDYPFVRGDEVAPVVEPLGGCGALVVELEDPEGDPAAIKAVPERVDRSRRRNQPDGVEGLAAFKRNHTKRRRAHQSHPSPQQLFQHGDSAPRSSFAGNIPRGGKLERVDGVPLLRLPGIGRGLESGHRDTVALRWKCSLRGGLNLSKKAANNSLCSI